MLFEDKKVLILVFLDSGSSGPLQHVRTLKEGCLNPCFSG